MLRNLPRGCSRSFLQRLLDLEGFQGRYTFVYAPADFQTLVTSGFAFVCFCDHNAAAQAKRHFQGFSRWGIQACRKRCNAAWSGAVQGLEQHIERYRNSSVMHPQVPDEPKPAVFRDGVRVPFPEPTREIPAPNFRQHIERYCNSPVMHPLVPDEPQPAAFIEGVGMPPVEPFREILAPNHCQHMERCHNSSIMHPLVPNELKPAVFIDGVRLPFPERMREMIPAPTFRGSISGHR
jgi:hypothetical protein